MKMNFKILKRQFQLTVIAAALGATANLAQAGGPTVSLPSDDANTASDGHSHDHDGVTADKSDEKGNPITDRPRMPGHHGVSPGETTIGGYAEMHFNRVMPDRGDTESEVDFHRFVLFIAHEFDDSIRFYSELEVEHALAGDGKPGEVGLEQAFLEWDLVPDRLSLRAGILLIPMGIVNQWHEPPIFNGVERPRVDKLIIPSTWREAGVGIAGEITNGLRYQAYLVSGLDPLAFSANNGLRGGRQAVAEARSDGLALTGRVEWEPRLSTVVGAAFYAGVAGANAGELFNAVGNSIDPTVPVVGGALDGRTRIQGVEARAVLAGWKIGDTDKLRDARDSTGDVVGTDVGSTILGAYAEVGYDVLYRQSTRQQLVPFTRIERYDTMFRVTGRAREAADEARAGTDYVFGVSYRPIPQVVFKADGILRNPDGANNHAFIIDLGIGTMF